MKTQERTYVGGLAARNAPARPGEHQLGFGLGLRNLHFDYILQHWPKVDWFEAISENFMDSGGRPRWVLDQIAERYPIVLHGVSMSIGSLDPLNYDYLGKLKRLADATNARWISDHLCWTGVLGINSHDLLPLPLTEETLNHVATRVRQVQDFLERPLVLENPSTYIQFHGQTYTEPAFLQALCRETGCLLLLDINNVYVSCFNAGLDPNVYLDMFPFDRVVQMHLAGHQHCGTHIIDTHDGPVSDSVWPLFKKAWQCTGGAATLLEWDGNIPPFEQLHEEVLGAKALINGDCQWKGDNVNVSNGKTVSTPLSFMVPDVMSNTEVQTS